MARRRITIYFSWNRTRETTVPLGVLNNRYPALFELRRALWPHFEWAGDLAQYPQDIGGFLDHVVLVDFERFRKVASEASAHPVALLQREGAPDCAGILTDGMLAEIDTLIVVSLDHMATEQVAAPSEIAAVKRFLERSGTCLVVSPHHDVGANGGRAAQQTELLHHGDRLVPSQQRLSGFARSLLAGIGFAVENRFGLSPAVATDGNPARLELSATADEMGFLTGVSTFNMHPHLPHFEVPPSLHSPVWVLARQRINPSAPMHPFCEGGRDSFDAMLWIPPDATRRGHVLVCDATLWSSAFGGEPSLTVFWQNVATLEA